MKSPAPGKRTCAKNSPFFIAVILVITHICAERSEAVELNHQRCEVWCEGG